MSCLPWHQSETSESNYFRKKAVQQQCREAAEYTSGTCPQTAGELSHSWKSTPKFFITLIFQGEGSGQILQGLWSQDWRPYQAGEILASTSQSFTNFPFLIMVSFYKTWSMNNLIWFSQGFGFVEFEDYRDADDAVYELNGKDLLGERWVLFLLFPATLF